MPDKTFAYTHEGKLLIVSDSMIEGNGFEQTQHSQISMPINEQEALALFNLLRQRFRFADKEIRRDIFDAIGDAELKNDLMRSGFAIVNPLEN